MSLDSVPVHAFLAIATRLVSTSTGDALLYTIHFRVHVPIMFAVGTVALTGAVLAGTRGFVRRFGAGPTGVRADP